MQRREFLGTAAAGAVTALVPGLAGATAHAPRTLARIGVQAYGVRRELDRDLTGTLVALHRMGYSDVEINWHLGMTPSPALKAALATSGLRASSAHVSADAMSVGWQRHLDAASSMGLTQVVCPGFTPDARQSLDDWRAWADFFNTAGLAAQRHGIRVAYHTEPDVYPMIDGKVPLDVFADRLDPRYARLQLDVGNTAMAGVDPAPLAERYADRIWSFHLKDVPVMGRMGDTELGQGKVDLRRVLASMKDPQHTLVFVEQEDAKDPIASARRDYDYIATLKY
jgi:sugar phosphate isomerase/epimerase